MAVSDPGLERDRPGRADGQDLLVLDRAQQLGLGRTGQLADLVEEDRARAGGDEQPVVIAVGTGVCARTWPKSWFSSRSCGIAAQLTARNSPPAPGPAHERRRATSSLPVPVSPVTSTVVRLGATLRIRVFTACDRRALAHQGDDVSLRVELPPQSLVFPEQPAQANQAVDPRSQVLEEDRLHQVVVRTALEGRDGIFDRGITP